MARIRAREMARTGDTARTRAREIRLTGLGRWLGPEIQLGPGLGR